MGKKDLLQDKAFQNDLRIVQGWRAIGQCIGRSRSTARRWYDNHHLPVRISPVGRPFAFVSEIETFMDKFDKLAQEDPELRERRRRHAAMMRSRKKRQAA